MASEYCPTCGTGREEAWLFCRKCGFDFRSNSAGAEHLEPEPSPGLTPTEESQSQAPTAGAAIIDCPRGPHPDLVRKVTALAASGNLQFACPPQPHRDSVWGPISIVVLAFGVIGLSMQLIPHGPHTSFDDSSLIFSLLFIGSVLGVKAVVFTQRRDAHGLAMERWNVQQRRWLAMWYCTKDDLLFIPKDDGGWLEVEGVDSASDTDVSAGAGEQHLSAAAEPPILATGDSGSVAVKRDRRPLLVIGVVAVAVAAIAAVQILLGGSGPTPATVGAGSAGQNPIAAATPPPSYDWAGTWETSDQSGQASAALSRQGDAVSVRLILRRFPCRGLVGDPEIPLAGSVGSNGKWKSPGGGRG